MKYLHKFKLPTGHYYISKGPFENDSPRGKFKCWINGGGIGPYFDTLAHAEIFLSNQIMADLRRRNAKLKEEVDDLGDTLDIIDEDMGKVWIYNFETEMDN